MRARGRAAAGPIEHRASPGVGLRTGQASPARSRSWVTPEQPELGASEAGYGPLLVLVVVEVEPVRYPSSLREAGGEGAARVELGRVGLGVARRSGFVSNRG